MFGIRQPQLLVFAALWELAILVNDAHAQIGSQPAASAPTPKATKWYEDKELQLELGYTRDDNINRSKAGPDVRADNIYSFGLSPSLTFRLSENTRLIATGSFSAERFGSYTGLSNLSAGAEGVYQYRASSEFDAPTWALFAKVSATRYEAGLRSGARTAYGISVSQPLTDRINAFAAASLNSRTANSAVFQTKDASVRFNLDYALRGGNTLYAGAEYRDGDMVSTAQPSLENITIAKVFVQDDAFPGGQFFSYRVLGTTWLTTLGYNMGLGAKGSLDFSWRHVEATPSVRPAWVTSPRSYVTEQLGASYLFRF